MPWKLHIDQATGEEALFDLAPDPQERSPDDIGTSAKARKAIERLRSRLARSIREELDHTLAETSDSDLPIDVQAALEARGYLHDEPERQTSCGHDAGILAFRR
jgi:hypothetical protein